MANDNPATGQNTSLLYKGKSFSSEEEIVSFFEEYKRTHKKVFVRGTSVKLDKVEKRKKDDATEVNGQNAETVLTSGPFSPDLDFYQIKYVCKFGKKRKSSSTGKRAASTFKRNCKAYVLFQIAKDKKSYIVTRFHLHHQNHQGLEGLIDHIPEVRKMTAEEQKTALQFLLVGAKPSRLQMYLRELCNKQIRRKDLQNLLDKANKMQTDNISEVAKILQDQYAANVQILENDGEFQGLYFSDPNMRKNFELFSEIVCIDGTYKIFKRRYTLILIAVEDNNGRTQVVGVGVLVNETRSVLKWLIESFKKDHGAATDNIQGFMSDKDMTERSVIKEIFPNVSLFICQFHVLRSFSREICTSKMSINRAEREQALFFIDKMVKSASNEDYMKWYQKFLEGTPQEVIDYFQKNWEPIKNEWTKFNIFKCNFGNLTNNRIESLNQKLKGFLNKYNSLTSFIHDFFLWNMHRNLEMLYKDVQKKLKVPVEQKFATELQWIEDRYRELLTEYAFNKFLNQLDLSKHVTLKESCEETFDCQAKIDGELTVVTPYSCCCLERWSMQLPCRHILAVRKKFEMTLFDKSLCDNRWYANAVNISEEPASSSSQKIVTCTRNRVSRKTRLTIGEKRQKVKVITDEIVSIVSEMTDKKFYEKLAILKALLSELKNNKDIVLQELVDGVTQDLEVSFGELSVSTDDVTLQNLKLPTPPKVIGKVSKVLSCTIAQKSKKLTRKRK